MYHNVRSLPNSHLVPSAVMMELKKAYHQNIARNMYLFAELRNIVAAFQSAEIEIITLKGAALAGVVYQDAGLRTIMDIDLLVRNDDLNRAHALMTELHYTASGGSESEQRFYEEHYHLPPYHHRDKSVVVEIHRHVTKDAIGMNMESWWERARTEHVLGCSMLVPSPADMLLHLCIHLYNHGYENGFVLRGVCDISETVRHYNGEIDWKLLEDEIKKYGMEKQVYSVLHLAWKYYLLSDRYLSVINERCVDHAFLGILEKSLFSGSVSPPYNTHLVKSMVAGTVLQKIRYLMPHIFPSREEMSKRYPVSPSSTRIVWYYLMHPFRLMKKYGKSFLEIIWI